jgi:prepilin-type N-terminal cleavage/methylation domain-containing protein
MRGFTLVEVLIVVVLLGTLMGLLFRTYITISQIAAKVENEKAIQNETLFLMQTLENLTENYSIDYSRYTSAPLT